MLLLSLIQDVDIEEKIINAPNNNYEIGVFIGSMLPFVAFAVIAYLIYRHNKRRINKE